MATKLLSTQKIVNLSADPASGSAGEIYYNTTDSELKFYDGYSWLSISSSLLIYDGGEPTTYKWENNPNGGAYNATFFVGLYDGGGP
jgi:hypothetical protein